MNKKIIWFIGGMACGKSTQRRMFCESLGTADKIDYEGEEDGINYCFSTFGNVAALGKIKQNSVCDGLDACFSKIKKVGGELSLIKSLEICDVVLIEGSQTSLKWVDFIKPIASAVNAEFYLFHFNLEIKDNLERLRQRQSRKRNLNIDSIELTDKNIESIVGKNGQFKNAFDKLQHDKDIICIRIDATQSKDEIFNQVIHNIWK